MSHEIDPALVLRIAQLARLRLSPAEVDLFSEQLGRILEYVRQLDTVSTDGVAPLETPLPMNAPLRPDEPQPPLDLNLAMSNAPQREGPFFRVPAIFEGGSGA